MVRAMLDDRSALRLTSYAVGRVQLTETGVDPAVG